MSPIYAIFPRNQSLQHVQKEVPIDMVKSLFNIQFAQHT